MGKVFLALDQKTGKEVAVKIVKDQKQWDRERVILQKLKHTKGVPELFFAGKEKELFLVMEYILGKSLKRYGRVCGKLYKKKSLLWMIKICKVLNKIHEQGIIHMDLKPENIMLDRFGNIYLIDFGAALFAGEKLSGYGTKNYASKKQAKTEERADIYFDIYSLGKTMESLLKATDAVQKIIEKCLIDDDAKRYHNIRQIQADFERILRICRMKKGFMVVIAVFCIQNLWNQIQREEKREKEVIVQKKSQREIKKAMAYFYGTDQIQKNTQLARVYLERCRGMKKNVSSYLVLLDVLDDRRNDISAEKLMKIVQDCQTDVHDFWSAYFYLHFYTVNTAKLSENVWKEAEKMLEQIQKYPQKEEYQKLVEADRINLYEREAEK